MTHEPVTLPLNMLLAFMGILGAVIFGASVAARVHIWSESRKLARQRRIERLEKVLSFDRRRAS